MRILTVGHSNRTLDDLIQLLSAHGVQRLIDIRTIPGSRRHPHFAKDRLAESLAAQGIDYRHMVDLGGFRRPVEGSPNTGWKNAHFQGYADHMATAAFQKALEDLIALGEDETTAMMCAEANWWQCHRRLVADALVARGIEVGHIMSTTRLEPHETTPFARVDERGVTYPGLI